MSLSTPILTTSSEIDTRLDDCSATAVVMKDDTDKAQMMSIFLIMGLPPQDEQRGTTIGRDGPRNPITGIACCGRRERPRGSRAAEQGDELAPLHLRGHSITSSARTSSVGGTSRRSALAVVRLMTRSNLVGCSTGMSLGFAPRRILSTIPAVRLHWSRKFGPYDISPPVSTY